MQASFVDLPRGGELHHVIFSNLVNADRLNGRLVCKEWNRQLGDPAVRDLIALNTSQANIARECRSPSIGIQAKFESFRSNSANVLNRFLFQPQFDIRTVHAIDPQKIKLMIQDFYFHLYLADPGLVRQNPELKQIMTETCTLATLSTPAELLKLLNSCVLIAIDKILAK